jgi:hypothetical protein
VPLLTADIDHRDHATIELVIRDLKDQALAHFPSGQMHANSAWTVITALAHNLGRWSTLIGLPDQPVQTARARRRHLLQIPARLTRTSRQWTLRMPARWPWQHDFATVLAAIRAHLTGSQQFTDTDRPLAGNGTIIPTPNQRRGAPAGTQPPKNHRQTAPHRTARTITTPIPSNPPHPASRSVAVGTAVADRPPRRSQRAGLPHWASALGDGGESLLGPGAQDPRLR